MVYSIINPTMTTVKRCHMSFCCCKELVLPANIYCLNTHALAVTLCSITGDHTNGDSNLPRDGSFSGPRI